MKILLWFEWKKISLIDPLKESQWWLLPILMKSTVPFERGNGGKMAREKKCVQNLRLVTEN